MVVRGNGGEKEKKLQKLAHEAVCVTPRRKSCLLFGRRWNQQLSVGSARVEPLLVSKGQAERLPAYIIMAAIRA